MSDDVDGLAFLEHTHAFDLVKKISASDKLHYDVVTSLIFKKLEHAGDMRVHSVLKNRQFVLVQFLIDIGDKQTALADNFDGTRYLRELVLAKLH